MHVREIMTTSVATVRAVTPLKDVARELLEREVSGMPVVDADGQVVGVISEGDLVARQAGPERRRRHALLAWLLERRRGDEQLKLEARLAGDAMTAPAITIEPFWSVAGAAQQMVAHGVKRLPVVQHGRLVGIVTRADLVRAFARPDAEIEEELRQELAVHQAMSGDRSGPVAVAVMDGEATLRGHFERRADAEFAAATAARVPGVLGVRSDLTWSDDSES
jgi:CBS domain-containing protein